MAEFLFSLKCLLSAVVILFVMQIKIGNSSIEDHTQVWMTTSPIALNIKKVASGGALALKNVYKSFSDYVGQTFKSEEVQRAAKFNIEFKRSPQVENKKNNQN